MKIQVITADEKIESDRDKVALRYGPLVYVVETADQTNIDKIIDTDHFFPQWRKDLLNGIITINGKWVDGAPLIAIPYYARFNRIDESNENNPERSVVWINN